MNKKEVAAFLGKSERQVVNYVNDGRLPVRYEKGKTNTVGVYDAADVERLKIEIESGATSSARFESATGEALEVGDSEGSSLALVSVTSPVIVKQRSREVRSEMHGFTFSPEQFETLLNRVVSASVTPGLVPVPSRAGQGSSLQELAVKPLLQSSEINALYGVPEREVRSAMKDGSLPSQKIGRALKSWREDIDAWIKNRSKSV